MTYRELNALFWTTWGDDKGIIRGRPVEFIYRMNSKSDGKPEAVVNITELEQELNRAGLKLNYDRS